MDDFKRRLRKHDYISLHIKQLRIQLLLTTVFNIRYILEIANHYAVIAVYTHIIPT